MSDIAYSGMETIDLCDKVKREESCVFLDDSALYNISCRVQKLRSYKVLSLSFSLSNLKGILGSSHALIRFTN